MRVKADFALFNHGLIVFKDVFDRVFERDDVFFEIGVDVFDHRRERRGFAGTGRTGHQHDAARRFRDFFDLWQQAEFLKTGHACFDIAHRQAPLAALLKKIRAEPSDSGDEIGKINFALLLQSLFQMHRRDFSTILFIHSAVGCGQSTATNSRLMRKMTGVPILK